MLDLDAMWDAADAALLRCLELAHQSFLAHGLSVGSVLVFSSVVSAVFAGGVGGET